jgi:homoserine trans-succinylase
MATTLQEVQHAKQIAIDELFDNLGVFFAFSNQQFEESKTPLAEGDKYVQFANGSFVPKSNYEKLKNGFDAAKATMREQINANDLGEAEVLAELENQEAFYTGSIESTMEALGDDYSREFVKSVYFKNQNKYDDQGWFN